MNTQIATIEIFDNSIGSQYYILGGHRFDINFPIKWAVENLNEYDGETALLRHGPVHCGNCATFGAINNVFVGYCSNCALYNYNYSRGNGFIDIGVEQIVDCWGEELNPQNSIWNTYMKNVQQNQIGTNVVIIEEEGEAQASEEEEEIEEPTQVEPEIDNIIINVEEEEAQASEEEEEKEEEDYDW